MARAATERALERLEAVVAGDRRVAALTGAPGLGKTLLLRLLEHRHAGATRPLYLPYASLTLDEMGAWVLGLLGHPANDRKSIDALREAARPRDASSAPLLLLIDEANSMPLDTARALGECVEACGGDLRLVLAAPDDARTSRVLAALGVEPLELRLEGPMSEDETQRYVTERLRSAAAPPAEWRRLGREIVRRLHGLSGGNPRRLHVLASEVIRGEPGERVLRQIEPTWPDLLVAEDALEVDDWELEAAVDSAGGSG